ncbi:MAG: hypothetical protein IKL00_07620 [Oscillospiraceae bacterium]|nr:hypothetical protein [Oscillospiraceae bacterium]
MEFMRRAKGSISIFLCIILLPMVTYSTMIIDASRMQVARTSIATAGDLAMNAALSEYEKVLQDMYGLFVLTENQESFENQLQAYFTETLEGKITTTEKDLITGMSDEIVQAIINPNAEGKLNNLNNMLAMTVEEDAFDYVPIDGSTLANQAIMKRQIIEYMKYKGPVSLASTLLPKLDFLKDSSKQTEVVEMKVEYTKKLSSLEDACQAAWQAIESESYAIEGKSGTFTGYQKERNNYNDEAYGEISTVNAAIAKARSEFEKMSRAILMSKHPQRTIDQNQMSEWSWYGLKYNEDMKNTCDTYDPPKDAQLYVYDNYKNDMIDRFDKIIDIKDDGAGVINNYFDITYPTYDQWKADNQTALENNVTNGYNNWKDSVGLDVTSSPKTGTTLRYEAKIGEKYNALNTEKQNLLNDYSYDISKLADFYQKQNAAYEEVKNYIEDYRKIKTAQHLLINVKQNYFTNLYNYYSIKRDLYEVEIEYKEEAEEAGDEEAANAHATEAAKHKEDLDKALYFAKLIDYTEYFTLHGPYSTNIENLLNIVNDKSVYTKYAEHYAQEADTELFSYYSSLIYVKDACVRVSDALATVITKIEEAETQQGEWQKSVNGLADGTTKSSMQSDLDSTTDGLEKSDVEALKKVFDDMKEKFEKRITNVYAIKFMGVNVCNVYSWKLDNYINHEAYNTLNSTTEELRAKQIVRDVEEGYFDRTSVPSDEPSPQAIEINGNGEDQKFYLTLKSICETKKPEMTTTQTQQVEVINESAGGSGSSSAANAEEPTEATTDSANDNGAKDLNLGQIYNEISAKSEENGLKADDDEGPSGDSKVKNVKISTNKDDYDGKAGDSTDSLKEGKNLLKTIGDLGAKVAEYAYMEEYFTEMFTCRTDATNKDGGIVLLNGYSIPAPGTDATTMAKTVNRNAPWFGREIEYIIWGDSNMNGNWVKTDALLYTIRFALNAVYAFTSPEIQSFALQVATAIAGWTVIGVPIVQACITVALALAESAYDLVLLHKGEDVPIYKSVTTFVCSPTGIVSEAGKQAANKLIEKGTEVAKQAIDNKIDEITDKVGATLEEKKQAALDYVAEYTAEQANEINTTIANMSVIPLMNQLMPVATEIDKKTDAKKDDLKIAVEAAVGKAFDSITISIDDMPADNIVKPLAQLVYTEDFKNSLKTEVSGYFTKEFDSATEFSAVNKLYELKAYLIDDTVDENSEGIISKEIWKYNDKINGAIKDKADALTEKIKGVTEETADNLKSVMHEGFDDMSAKLSGTVTKTLDEAAEKLNLNKVKDASASKGFTLNYKEYCKIFVLVKLAAGQEPKMLNRAATLIEANVRTANGTNNSEFHIVEGYTLVGIKSNVKMGTLFPWGVSVSDSSDTTGSVDMSLDLNNLGENFVTINYQAVNGY